MIIIIGWAFQLEPVLWLDWNEVKVGVRCRTLTQYGGVAPACVKVFRSDGHPRSRFPLAPRKVSWPRNHSSCSSCQLQGRPSLAAAPRAAHLDSGPCWSSTSLFDRYFEFIFRKGTQIIVLDKWSYRKCIIEFSWTECFA